MSCGDVPNVMRIRAHCHSEERSDEESQVRPSLESRARSARCSMTINLIKYCPGRMIHALQP